MFDLCEMMCGGKKIRERFEFYCTYRTAVVGASRANLKNSKDVITGSTNPSCRACWRRIREPGDRKTSRAEQRDGCPPRRRRREEQKHTTDFRQLQRPEHNFWNIQYTATMVRVWYEPPPGGPRSHLNRGGYGAESAMEPLFMKKLARMRPAAVIIPAVGLVSLLAYLPLSKY